MAKAIRQARRAVARRIEPRDPEPDLKWDVPIGVSLQGAAALRQLLHIDEQSYLLVAGQAWGDSRAYVLYTALDEVKKSAIYLMRLRDFLVGPELSPREDRITRLMVTQLVEEQQARVRRLLEVLVLLILFSATNEQANFRHLLLLEELDDLLSANADLEEFYGARSANIDDSIDSQIEWIRDLEQKVDIGKAWYLFAKEPLGARATLRPGRLLSSMRTRVRDAMPQMTSGEKLLFGFSYANMYGHASEAIHYTAGRKDFRLVPGQEASAITGLGLLNLSILDRCHALLGRPDVPVVSRLQGMLQRTEADRLLQLATVRGMGVGDFVLAYGDLAEVVEVRESRYAYRSYRVRYLAEKPKPGIHEDWFPARYVQSLYTRQQFMEGLARLVREGKLPADIASRMGSLSGVELQSILRASMTHTWQIGLKDWVRSRAGG